MRIRQIAIITLIILEISSSSLRACEQTGRQVVVLIDEYDAPLLDVMHEERDLPILRHVMRNFYSPLKACDPYLRFVFLTGITKFSQLSIFSELNNIENISMDEPYAAICGITEEEMRTQMAGHITQLADKLKVSDEEALQKLKENYDGYHFTWPSPDVYNPFSLMMAFTKGKIDAYRFGSGTPTYLIPNKEVRIGLMKSLIPQYVTPDTLATTSTVVKLARLLRKDNMDEALSLIRDFLLTVPYCDNTDYEGHYQQLFYIIFSLLGYYVDVEVRTPRGRVDMVMHTATTLYVVELKIGKQADTAIQQINLKDYPSRFALCGLPTVKVGISFDTEKRTISDWIIE